MNETNPLQTILTNAETGMSHAKVVNNVSQISKLLRTAKLRGKSPPFESCIAVQPDPFRGVLELSSLHDSVGNQDESWPESLVLIAQTALF